MPRRVGGASGGEAAGAAARSWSRHFYVMYQRSPEIRLSRKIGARLVCKRVYLRSMFHRRKNFKNNNQSIPHHGVNPSKAASSSVLVTPTTPQRQHTTHNRPSYVPVRAHIAACHVTSETTALGRGRCFPRAAAASQYFVVTPNPPNVHTPLTTAPATCARVAACRVTSEITALGRGRCSRRRPTQQSNGWGGIL